MKYNTYYVAFARSHGLTPEEQDEALQDEHGSWNGTEFILWINARHREFREIHGLGPERPYSDAMLIQFERWLFERVEIDR